MKIYFRYGLSFVSGLNTEFAPECVSPPADKAAQDIRQLVLELFSDFLSPNGKYVDYKVWIKIKEIIKFFLEVQFDLFRECRLLFCGESSNFWSVSSSALISLL